MGFANNITESGRAIAAFLSIGFIGIIFLIIFGNLSTNLGFAQDTAGFNNTEDVISNLTGGVNTFFGFSNTIFTILAITLLIIILLGLLALVMKVTKMTGGSKGGEGGFSGF